METRKNDKRGAIFITPILATTDNYTFDRLKSSSEAVSCIGDPFSMEGIQILSDAEGDRNYFIYAGQNPQIAKERAREVGIVLEGDKFLRAESWDQLNRYLGHK